MSTFLKNKKGFTLLEVLISSGILIQLMFGIAMFTFTQSNVLVDEISEHAIANLISEVATATSNGPSCKATLLGLRPNGQAVPKIILIPLNSATAAPRDVVTSGQQIAKNVSLDNITISNFRPLSDKSASGNQTGVAEVNLELSYYKQGRPAVSKKTIPIKVSLDSAGTIESCQESDGSADRFCQDALTGNYSSGFCQNPTVAGYVNVANNFAANAGLNANIGITANSMTINSGAVIGTNLTGNSFITAGQTNVAALFYVNGSISLTQAQFASQLCTGSVCRVFQDYNCSGVDYVYGLNPDGTVKCAAKSW